MKILAINGSHRKGNIDFMLEVILDSAKENGADIEIIKLKDNKIDFCSSGDNCCQKTLRCSREDDMPEIYPKLENTDILILASPSYFSNVTARMKKFMDRCNPYWFSKKLNGKKAFLLGVGGSGDKSIKEMLDRMRTFIRILGIEDIGSYYAIADKINELKENQKVIKELQSIGKKLSRD